MSGEDICELIPIVILFIIVAVFGWQFLRLFNVIDEEDKAWNELHKRLDELNDE